MKYSCVQVSLILTTEARGVKNISVMKTKQNVLVSEDIAVIPDSAREQETESTMVSINKKRVKNIGNNTEQKTYGNK